MLTCKYTRSQALKLCGWDFDADQNAFREFTQRYVIRCCHSLSCEPISNPSNTKTCENRPKCSCKIQDISILIDHMHMTSQKGAQLRWGSNKTLPRASSPSMQPGGQTLQATPPGWPTRARALRGWVPMRTASTTRARCATIDWRRCYGDVTLCVVNA